MTSRARVGARLTLPRPRRRCAGSARQHWSKWSALRSRRGQRKLRRARAAAEPSGGPRRWEFGGSEPWDVPVRHNSVDDAAMAGPAEVPTGTVRHHRRRGRQMAEPPQTRPVRTGLAWPASCSCGLPGVDWQWRPQPPRQRPRVRSLPARRHGHGQAPGPRHPPSRPDRVLPPSKMTIGVSPRQCASPGRSPPVCEWDCLTSHR